MGDLTLLQGAAVRAWVHPGQVTCSAVQYSDERGVVRRVVELAIGRRRERVRKHRHRRVDLKSRLLSFNRRGVVVHRMLGRSLCALGRYDEAEPLAEQGRDKGTTKIC